MIASSLQQFVNGYLILFKTTKTGFKMTSESLRKMALKSQDSLATHKVDTQGEFQK